MAVSAFWYGNGLKTAFNKEVDWDTDTVKMALATSSYTPDQDAHDYWDDVSANEVAGGNGYTTGGETLTAKSITYTGATNTLSMDSDPVTWSSSTITARYTVIWSMLASPMSYGHLPLFGHYDATDIDPERR